jgi:hypothetical protein
MSGVPCVAVKLLVVKEKTKKTVIPWRKRKHFFWNPQGTASCRRTVEWGEKEAHRSFGLVAGEGAITGGHFEI